MFLISHRCGLQLNRVYNRWIIPKKVMTSGQHSAAETPHKFRLWQAQGQNFAKGFFCMIRAWAPLYEPLMLDPLS